NLDGSRLVIDLIDRVLDAPLMWIGLTIGEDEMKRNVSLLFARPLLFVFGILALAQFESNPDHIEWNDRGERLSGSSRHEAAYGHKAVADAAADRRSNRGVLEIKFGGAKHCFLRLHLGRRRVDLGFRRKARLLHACLPGSHIGLIRLE